MLNAMRYLRLFAICPLLAALAVVAQAQVVAETKRLEKLACRTDDILYGFLVEHDQVATKSMREHFSLTRKESNGITAWSLVMRHRFTDHGTWTYTSSPDQLINLDTGQTIKGRVTMRINWSDDDWVYPFDLVIPRADPQHEASHFVGECFGVVESGSQ